MSTNRGIFESIPNQSAGRQDSPFAVVNEPAVEQVTSPFMAAARQDSPFSVFDDSFEGKHVEPGKPAKVPERRKLDSPFQAAEPSEGFGFEAPSKPYASSPFEVTPPPTPTSAAPFSMPAHTPAISPFSVEPVRGPSPTTQAAIAAFSNWQEAPVAPAPTPAPQHFEQPAPAFASSSPVPSAFAPPQQMIDPPPVPDSFQSDSFSIRQLELRAIFGVDREMSPDEILQRSRALPGMRNIARVSQQDMATIEALKQLIPNLGFGNGGLKLYSGSVPLEFIREGSVLLAVQTDGGFAPGVRETLMIVARELGRLS
jgi:hypothetical protein